MERLEETKDIAHDDSVADILSTRIWNKAIQLAKFVVKEVAKEYNGGWIPCIEQLPEQPKENPIFENNPLELYLVTVKNTEYAFRAFWNGKHFTDGFGTLDVIAWQPLPEPFKERD